jgi:hypothetical protein
MTLSKFIDGLKLLQTYYTNADGFNLGAEHDQIYAYPTDLPLTPEDVKKMDDLGWFQPDTAEGDEYDPDEGWSAFV